MDMSVNGLGLVTWRRVRPREKRAELLAAHNGTTYHKMYRAVSDIKIFLLKSEFQDTS
jgi:hypothetical protein